MSRSRLVFLLRALAALVLVLASAPMATAAFAGDTTQVSAKALTDHGCDSTQWHFVITGLDSDAQAPGNIAVSWADGGSATVALSRITGGVAHYSTTAHLDSTVTSATATIDAGWSGQFNLSSGPCGSSGGGSTSVTAAAPTVVGSCAQQAAIVTVPSTEHVSYTINGNAATAGEHNVPADANGHYTVVVAATASDGFTLTGTTHWDLSGSLSCGTTGGGGSGITTVSAKALTDHECVDSEWHFVITGLASDAQAPDHITVTWDGGVTADVALDVVTGHTAHYRTTDHLDLAVVSATANIDSDWDGQFNLSHGPCLNGSGTGDTSVSAGTPTVAPSCEDHDAVVTIPSTEHVVYTLNGDVVTSGQHAVLADANGHYTVVVVASAAAGFILSGTSSWDLSGTLSCGTGGTSVSAGTPTVAPSCEDHAAVVTIPSTEHVVYTLNGDVVTSGQHTVLADANGHYTVAVVASAAAGFTLSGTSSWDLSGTLSCGSETGGTGSTGGTGVGAGGTGSTTTPDTAVLGEHIGSGSGTAAAGTGALPHTGMVVSLAALVATGVGLVLLGLLLMTGRRRPEFVRVLAPARGRHHGGRRH
jgi:hypothetical protein